MFGYQLIAFMFTVCSMFRVDSLTMKQEQEVFNTHTDGIKALYMSYEGKVSEGLVKYLNNAMFATMLRTWRLL